MNSNKITNVATPGSATDAANKSYVDSALTSGSIVNNPTVADAANGNANYRVLFTTATSGRATLNHDAQLTYNPSSDILYAGTFSGNATTSTTAGYAASTTYAERSIGNKFTINGGAGYTNDISANTMLQIKDQGWGYGARIALCNWQGHNFTIGSDHSSGNSYVWTEQSGYIRFGTNNIERMRITEGGQVGIGTTAPEAGLHVAKTKNTALTGTVDYYNADISTTGTFGQNWTSGGTYPMGIISEGDIWIKSTYIWISSDKRIKKNIRDIHGNNALSQLRKIQPKIYNYIDFTNGNRDIYGFIAQDVEDIITSSSKIVKDYIPNFYCKGDIFIIEQANHIYEISTETEFKFEKVLDNSGNEISNYHIKLYDEKNNEYICTVIHRTDGNTIRVKCDKEYKFSTTEKYKNTVFIYGQEVHDFHNLDKNSIFTVATAALQEVDRQQQADKARIAELENQVSTLEATVATQQSIINDILERLKALEKA
jgi:hypothetical protein